MPKQVIIVGAGISGLATAYHLQRNAPATEVKIFEASQRPGGTIWTEHLDGFRVELGANGFLNSRDSTLQLCRSLGIEDQLIPASESARHRYLFLNNRLQKLPEGRWSFITSPLLSWRGKLQVLKEKRQPARLEGEEESVYDFVARRAGSQAADVFADALVTGIYAGDPKLLSMVAAFPRIMEMEREHGSVFRGMTHAGKVRRARAAAAGEPYQPGNKLFSFGDGLRHLIEALVNRLHTQPTYGACVTQIEHWVAGVESSKLRQSYSESECSAGVSRTQPRPPNPKLQACEGDSFGWIVHTADGESRRGDAVVLTCPAYVQAEILSGLDAELAREAGSIEYSPAVVMALGYRREHVPRRLNGFGYIAPQRTRRDVLGVQWCSSIFPDRAPPGCVLLRAIAGGWHRSDIVKWDDGRVLHAVREELRTALGVEAPPVFDYLARWPQAIPQYHLGHRRRVERIEAQAASHQGLFLGGNAYRGVALNDCTEEGEKLAERVKQYLSTC